MVYKMHLWTDGGCRGNGYEGAYGAAAVVHCNRWGRNKATKTRLLNPRHAPTSQRAELVGIVRALQIALEKREELNEDTYLEVKIHTDSRYAHDCMTQWSYKWQDNGWLNNKGDPVANSDLIKMAIALEQKVEEHGNVIWQWVSRNDNVAADDAVNEELDDMEEED